ncbi:MAG: hypothetical protein LBU02_02090 [Rickettsiales bacterium]|nr:hypothetical protein [Rickettsiales bacterium]
MTYEMHGKQELYSKCPEADYWTNEGEEYVLCGPLSFLEEGSPSVEMQPTTDEEELIQKFYKEMKNVKEKNTQKPQKSNDIENTLEDIKRVADKYLKQGLRLNLRCGDEDKTVTNFIFWEVLDALNVISCCPIASRQYGFSDTFDDQGSDDENELSEKSLNTIKHITSKLVLRGGKIRHDFYRDNGTIIQATSNFEGDLNRQYKEVEDKLKNVAHESILNKSEHTQEDGLEVNIIDNGYFYIKCAQDSIVEPAQITNNQEIKDPELRVCILQIGESAVKIEKVEGEKRNYADISGSIEMSFVTRAGKIGICLHCSEENSNEIKVEFADEESKARFDELENEEKKSLGPNCFLGGKVVAEVIGKSFERNSSISTNEVIKQPCVPYTSMQISQPPQKKVEVGIASGG